MALNRSKFLNTVAERAGAHRRDVEHVWENALGVIQEAVKKGEDVTISGFGKFKQRATKARPKRTGKNPFTGETQIFAAKPASKKPAFLPAKQFKEFVSGTVKSLPKLSTRPMVLGAATGGTKAAPKKAAAKKKAGKKAGKKAPARKAPAKKKTTAKKGAAKRRR